MGLIRLAAFASATMATLSMAADLLFYDGLTDREYTEATTVLGYTGRIIPSTTCLDTPC